MITPLLSLLLGVQCVLAQVPIIDLSKLGKDVRISVQIDMALQEYGEEELLSHWEPLVRLNYDKACI